MSALTCEGGMLLRFRRRGGGLMLATGHEHRAEVHVKVRKIFFQKCSYSLARVSCTEVLKERRRAHAAAAEGAV